MDGWEVLGSGWEGVERGVGIDEDGVGGSVLT